MDKAKVGEDYTLTIIAVPPGVLEEFEKALVGVMVVGQYANMRGEPGYKVEGVVIRRPCKLREPELFMKRCSGPDRRSFCDQPFYFFPQWCCTMVVREQSRPEATVHQLPQAALTSVLPAV